MTITYGTTYAPQIVGHGSDLLLNDTASGTKAQIFLRTPVRWKTGMRRDEARLWKYDGAIITGLSGDTCSGTLEMEIHADTETLYWERVDDLETVLQGKATNGLVDIYLHRNGSTDVVCFQDCAVEVSYDSWPEQYIRDERYPRVQLSFVSEHRWPQVIEDGVTILPGGPTGTYNIGGKWVLTGLVFKDTLGVIQGAFKLNGVTGRLDFEYTGEFNNLFDPGDISSPSLGVGGGAERGALYKTVDLTDYDYVIVTLGDGDHFYIVDPSGTCAYLDIWITYSDGVGQSLQFNLVGEIDNTPALI